MPSGLWLSEMSVKILRTDMGDNNEATGSITGRVFGPPRWSFDVGSGQDLTEDQATAWEALLMDLEGSLNVLAFYDVARPEPRGTMRGTLTLGQATAIGDRSLLLAGAAGTLRKGDWIQVGTGLGTSQTVKVRADATASGGACTVQVAHPIRRVYSVGTAVAWDKPVVYCRNMGSAGQWTYQAGSKLSGNFAMQLVETFK
jgi:hypothetical protein